MSALTPVSAEERSLVAAARAGDERAFEALVAAHQRALHLHCYRMLGSYDDAEEATQETLLSAWRGLATYEQRAPLRHWLYRIATTTCLKLRTRRERQPISLIDVRYVRPYPDRLLDELGTSETDPAATAETRESVALVGSAGTSTHWRRSWPRTSCFACRRSRSNSMVTGPLPPFLPKSLRVAG
jgi:RNA polymerase sigma-70 factor, ECF subfamily